VLVLTRKLGETITVGEDIRITIVSIDGHHVRLGVQAPRSVPIYRAEVQERIRLENQRAARATHDAVRRLACALKQNTETMELKPLGPKEP
jgi:carbon storage regulator